MGIIRKRSLLSSHAPIWTLDGQEGERSALVRKATWETMIASKGYVMPGQGSPDVDDWLKASELLSFLSGAQHLSNRRFQAYGDITVNVGKGNKRTFAIVTETNLWMLTATGKRLRFFMAPHATLLTAHINDSDTGLKATHEWTEAALLEYHRGSVRTTPITNLVATLTPWYVKGDGHANRRSESTVLAARRPQGYLYLPCVWAKNVGGRSNSLEQGVCSIAPDGTIRFLAHDTTREVGDVRLLKRELILGTDGTVTLRADMVNTITFEPASGAALTAALEAPYWDLKL